MDKIQNIINGSYSGILIFTTVSLILIIVLCVICLLFKKIKTKEELIKENYITRAFFPVIPIWIIFLIAYILFAIYSDKIKPKTDFQQKIFLSILIAIIGFSLYRFSIILKKIMHNWVDKKLFFMLNENIVKWGITFFKFIILVMTFIAILKIYGVNITALVAGLGIGGVAVALAAQDTLSNILGCAIIILDKPFVIGQRIKLLDYDGVIEYVGIRSTRLRTLEDNVVIIPNKNITSANIENVNARNNIKQLEDISLSPDISSETIKIVIENIKEILKENSLIKDDYGVFFDKRDAISVNLKMWYWVNTTDYLDYMNTKEEINYQISNMLEKFSIKYAMPRSTVFLKKNDAL